MRERIAARPLFWSIVLSLVFYAWTFVLAYWLADRGAGVAAGIAVIVGWGVGAMVRRELG